MEIKGRVFCMFEQSGTFKKEFLKLGYKAEDYDIQDDFGETDHVCDLFPIIEDAYDGKPSLFDSINGDDLIMAFFPCIYFCDNNVLYFKGQHINYKHWGMNQVQIIDFIIDRANKRHRSYIILLKLFRICVERGLRLIFENPFSTTHYLNDNFPFKPAFIDKNRRTRGDFFTKPTQYFFLNCEPTYGKSMQDDKPHLTIKGMTGRHGLSGLCSEERSMISPDYARNFICDFILGKTQEHTELDLFSNQPN